MAFTSKGHKVFNDVKNLRNLLLQERKSFGEDIDFYLLDFRTFYSKKGENKYKPVNDISLFNKNSNFTANIDIKQLYKIEICKKKRKTCAHLWNQTCSQRKHRFARSFAL